MEIQEHDGFIDVCCDANGINEIEIERKLRKYLSGEGYQITDNLPGRVGNPGIGTIFRFKLMED